MRYNCIKTLKTWYQYYMGIFVIKFILSLCQFIRVRREFCVTLSQVRDVEKAVRKYQLITYIYANGLFCVVLIVGNIIYF